MAKVGRPLKFQTLEELTTIADKYFLETPENEWTITGLALALDTTRELLIDYQEKDEFSDTIKKYKLKVHNAYEKDLRKKGRSGDIFALKNFGWKDKNETELSGKLEVKGATIEFADNPEAEDTNTNIS